MITGISSILPVRIANTHMSYLGCLKGTDSVQSADCFTCSWDTQVVDQKF